MKLENDYKMFNYFKIIDSDGDVIGVCGTEIGSINEVKFIEGLFNLGYSPVKITEDEYNNWVEGDEIRNF
jgi:hypothetical protein